MNRTFFIGIIAVVLGVVPAGHISARTWHSSDPTIAAIAASLHWIGYDQWKCEWSFNHMADAIATYEASQSQSDYGAVTDGIFKVSSDCLGDESDMEFYYQAQQEQPSVSNLNVPYFDMTSYPLVARIIHAWYSFDQAAADAEHVAFNWGLQEATQDDVQRSLDTTINAVDMVHRLIGQCIRRWHLNPRVLYY